MPPNPALSSAPQGCSSLTHRSAEVIGEAVTHSPQSARHWAPVLAQLPDPILDHIAAPIAKRAPTLLSGAAALRFALCVPARQAQMCAAIEPFYGLLNTPLYALLEQPQATITLVTRFVREVHLGSLRRLPIVSMQERLQTLRCAVLHGGFAPTSGLDTIGFVVVLDDVLVQLHAAPRLRYTPHGARLMPEDFEEKLPYNQARLAVEIKLNPQVLNAWLRAECQRDGLSSGTACGGDASRMPTLTADTYADAEVFVT